MKHIKLRGTLVQTPTGYQVKVTILEQTHRGYGFTHRSRGFIYRGFLFRSVEYPEYCGDSCLYLRGDNESRDSNLVIVPLDVWQRIKEVVKAYNEAYKE